MECLTVYHGTTITNCNTILKEKKFKHSVSSENLYQSIKSKRNTYHWLGDGIYFWPNNKRRAEYWANGIAKKANDRAAVMKVILRYEEERCFDLRLKENYMVVKEIIERLVLQFNKFICLENLDRDDKYKFIGYACDLIFNENNNEYDLVYYDFLINEGDIINECTSQICVKNDKVIEYDSISVI